MSTNAAPYDAPVTRPKPGQNALAFALTRMREEEDQLGRYVRQQWEAASAANLVALDAWRKIWPKETRFSFNEDEWDTVRQIERALAEAAHLLDTLSPTMLGTVADAVVQGVMDADSARRLYDET